VRERDDQQLVTGSYVTERGATIAPAYMRPSEGHQVLDVIGPELRKIADKHPAVGEVRGLGVFWAVELVKNRKTREPLVPFNASGADAKPMGELLAACKAGGVWPFVHFNRLQITPPCTTTPDEIREGLAAIDKALAVADKYCVN